MTLDHEEQEAMQLVLQASDRILSWGLAANHDELAAAVHVIQGFIVQRMLHRVSPQAWSDWYTGDEPPSDGNMR